MIRSIAIFAIFSQMLFASCVGLVYHHFGDKTPKSTSVTPELFKEHLKYLKDHNFTVLKASEALDLIDNLPKKCVVITADDAYLSIYTEAFHLLKEYNFPMTVFVTTEGVERKYPAYMSWEQMRELKESGLVEFGNHSYAHGKLINKEAFESDLIRSRDLIVKNLGTDNQIYAYPYGLFSDSMINVLQKHGYKAFVQHSGAFSATQDPLLYTRFSMADRHAKMSEFKLKVNSKAFEVVEAKPQKGFFDGAGYTLKLRVKKGGFNPEHFNCFYGGKRLEIDQIYNDKNIVGYQLEQIEVTKSVSSINCTARGNDGNYLWYSHAIFTPKVLAP